MSLLSRRLRLAFFVFGFASLLVACGERGPYVPSGDGLGLTSGGVPKQKPTPTPVPTPSRTPLPAMVMAGALTPSPGKMYFGAYANPTGLSGGDTPQSEAIVEGQIGRKLAIASHYLFFGQDLASKPMFDDFNNYRVPLVSIQCQNSDFAMASGQFDQTIHQVAQELKAYRWPVFFRYMYDANLTAGTGQPAQCHDSHDQAHGIFDPAEYIAAWQHVHDQFTNVEHVTNLVWVWSVSDAVYALNGEKYYPGDNYVDWVAFDDYDPHGFGLAGTIGHEYGIIATHNKPVMISEYGEGTLYQDALFSNAVNTLRTQFPQVGAFVYYDAIGYQLNLNYDYRVTNSAMSSFVTFANDPVMSYVYGK